MQTGNDAYFARKPFYVSVGAGQILEDPGAAAYELEIRANEEELNKLQELFEELSSMDEAQVFHFVKHPYGTATRGEINDGYEGILADIYKLLHMLGTDETKRHIESMHTNEPEGTV
ncbi:hypothetical protein DNH61_19210 [Paenibacillus sambharensis]|uniref:Hydrolase n=1 Tax=Paenibacillus sambharensis TaxID=1803190 RepID=A0A2W1L5A3_9BACL|nr:hypothetical protein [Paenibacillus sambharensis]PZD94089.1 hypothetical protein DNH61_19210 [Paenibacillus sambharensis]